jgi:NADPH:quinone reductase-like Zn-dependent oxidoreductase
MQERRGLQLPAGGRLQFRQECRKLLIRMHAASVNPADWKARRGLSETRLPAVLGRDASGTVEVSRADGFAEGDDVFGYLAGGGYLNDRPD